MLSRLWFAALVTALSGCGAPQTTAVPASPAPKTVRRVKPAPAAPTAAELLTQAAAFAAGSEYVQARRAYRLAERHQESSQQRRVQARLGRAQVMLATGLYAEAAELAQSLFDTQAAADARRLGARALARQGKLPEALRLLAPSLKNPTDYAAHTLAGELLIERGERDPAEAVLMLVIEAYNDDRIQSDNGRALAHVARAAHLLRSPEDANDAFNQAEQVLGHDIPMLLWRARLFLDHYDPAHADEVLSDVLEKAPHHALALTLAARVKLDQALDFDAAKRLVHKAHQSNPNLVEGYAVLAGIALRDTQIARSRELLAKGLLINPQSLELLSLQAAADFLAADLNGYARKKAQVFKLNPTYTRFYQIVGEYAEWEHRYDDIARMMREAINIDENDAKAHGQLGINLIRNGDDRGGLVALRRAHSKDPYNVRVYNTLRLYEETIPKLYTSTTAGPFRIRYPKAEQALLSRYVPKLLKTAWKKMVGYYAFEPSQPIGIELYSKREHFAIRTSGLPRTAIQGVCFGKTLATLTPLHEDFSQAMTLWHELAHVFHIQLSHNRVPRWFTEGLAEYETLVERKEWKRERGSDLFQALRAGRLPKIGAMNEAFTHAEDLLDVTVAYYASSQIVEMLAINYGRPALRKMLVLWGKGETTRDVIEHALGTTPEKLDTAFEEFVKARLARFSRQFVPLQRVGLAESVIARAKKEPANADAQALYALLSLRERDHDSAGTALLKALKSDPKHANAIWLSGRLALRQNRPDEAKARAERLVKLGQDGYETQLLLAKAHTLKGDKAQAALALGRAHEFDPEQTDALHGLLTHIEAKGDAAARRAVLAKLAALEEHNSETASQLSQILLAAGELDAAVAMGQAAIFADVEAVQAHADYAKALSAAGRSVHAEFEWLSATLSPKGDAKTLAAAHRELADHYAKNGAAAKAAGQREKADALLGSD